MPEQINYIVSIKVIGEVDSFTKGIDGAKRSVNSFEQTLGRIQRTMISFIALWAGRALISAITDSIKSLGDFQDQLSKSATIIDNSQLPQLFGSISMSIRDMSMEMGKSTTDLTGGLYEILSAMVPLDKSLQVLKLSSKAATAGVTDLKTAFKTGHGMLKSYGLAIENLEDVYNKQFAAVKIGIFSYGELENALGKLSPAAKKAGFSMDELLGTLAFLSQRGLTAREAGVSLGRMFDALSDPKKWEGFSKLGIEIYNVEGGLRPLIDIIDDFGKVLGGADDKTKALLNSIFGFEVRAQRAFVPATQGASDLRSIINEVRNSQSALNDAYDRYIALNLGRELKIQQEVWSDIQKSIGELALTSGSLFSLTDVLREISFIMRQKVLLAYAEIPDKIRGIKRDIDLIVSSLADKNKLKNLSDFSNQSVKEFENMMNDRVRILQERLKTYETLMDAFGEKRPQFSPITPMEPKSTSGDKVEADYWQSKIDTMIAGTSAMDNIIKEFNTKRGLEDLALKEQALTLERKQIDMLLSMTAEGTTQYELLMKRRVEIDKAIYRDQFAQAQLWLQNINTMYGMLVQTMTMASGESKKFAGILKVLRMGQIVIDTAAATMRTYADWGFTPAGWVAAAAVAAMGATQLGIVAAQPMAKGGIVPGIGNRDSVPAMLTPGEMVIPRNQVRNFTNSPTINVNLSGNLLANDPTQIQQFWREHLRDIVKSEIRSGRDVFFNG